MGEAIGLSLASAVVEKLGWTHATFLTDSQQILAKYMNGDNQAPPHDWSRIKPFVYNFFTWKALLLASSRLREDSIAQPIF